MAWWVYKCKRNDNPYGHVGDWHDFVHDRAANGRSARWGVVQVVSDLAKLNPRDRVFAYQTDRNELVAVVEMVEMVEGNDGTEVHFKLVEELGVKVRPLKERVPAIAEIPAFALGSMGSLHHISDQHAEALLAAARSSRSATS